MISHKTAALFDMDRTLVRCETASLYVRYQRSIGEATWRDSARMAWWVLQYTLGVLDAPRVARKALGSFRGMSETTLAARCDDWVLRDVACHITDKARETVIQHKMQGDIMALVTSSTPYAACPVARILGIDHVVASSLEVQNHAFTGKPEEPLCYGKGKLVRAQAFAQRLGFRLEDSTFYTDSHTDLPLLLAVGSPVVVNPDPRLRREAARRQWRVERW